MKKILILFITIFTLFVIGGCASTPKIKDVSGTVEILEHKGTRWGVAQPEWVGTVLSTSNQKTLSKALGIDKHIWVLTSSGENLDFLQNWVDQIDARAEIASSIKQGISDYVNAQLQGNSDEEVNKELERYSKRATMINLAGLNKETEWWTKTRIRLDKNSDYITTYNYMVVYSLDEKLYQKQIKQVLEDLNNFDNEENTKKMFEYFDDVIKVK